MMEGRGRGGKGKVRYHVCGEPALRVPLIHAVRVIRAMALTQHPRVQQIIQLGYCCA